MGDLRVTDLVIEYAAAGGEAVRPINHLNLNIDAGSLVVVLGPSGCGKTTLLSCIGGILSPSAGNIRFGSIEVTALSRRELTDYRRRSVGIIFQAFNLVASLTALENVMVPLWAAGWTRWEAQRRAGELLTRVGLGDRLTHRPGQLSGGQQQRVAVARALALDPPLILADEPTAQLDVARADEVMQLLRRLATGDRVVMVATHDTRILPLADVVIQLASASARTYREPEPVRLTRGAVLLEQGSIEDLVYIVADGEVDIVPESTGDAEHGLLRIGAPGAYAGELGPVFRIPRGASVHPRTEATVVGYTVEAFRKQFGHPPGVNP
ncbi:ATP-binding cassette domain-containing protein [Mycobacterium sp. pUA109]|uniref:ABC transporter ATP-binding protein n=1 Tax=Mycobacterium sp. pUA109 TaxID=3238982 RepID=UPI00351AEFE5